jgi:anthranilate phosphoribosyltransferase
LDEFSTTGEGDVFAIVGGAIDHRRLSPGDFGLRQARIEDLRGGTVEQNRDLALAVLGGAEGAHLDIVLANSALGLMAAGRAASPAEGVAAARESIASGRAMGILKRYVEYTHSVDPGV